MLYQDFVQGRTVSLPALAMRYSDFASAQRQLIEGGAVDGQLAFWRRHLVGLEALELPCDRARPAIQSTRGERFHFTMAADLATGVQMLAGRNGVTPFMAAGPPAAAGCRPSRSPS